MSNNERIFALPFVFKTKTTKNKKRPPARVFLGTKFAGTPKGNRRRPPAGTDRPPRVLWEPKLGAPGTP